MHGTQICQTQWASLVMASIASFCHRSEHADMRCGEWKNEGLVCYMVRCNLMTCFRDGVQQNFERSLVPVPRVASVQFCFRTQLTVRHHNHYQAPLTNLGVSPVEGLHSVESKKGYRLCIHMSHSPYHGRGRILGTIITIY